MFAVSLNERLSEESVVMVGPDRTHKRMDGMHAPECYVMGDDEGQISRAATQDMVETLEREGWTVVNGWSGQYLYSGPIMHTSEYVGGALETHIMENPGYYAALSATVLVDSEDEGAETEYAGWVLVYRPLEAPRYIAYMHTDIPGDISVNLRGMSSVKEAAEYLRSNSAFSSMTLHVCMGDADMWEEAIDFKTAGCPFDYPDYTLERGPRGGVRVERG